MKTLSNSGLSYVPWYLSAFYICDWASVVKFQSFVFLTSEDVIIQFLSFILLFRKPHPEEGSVQAPVSYKPC